MVDFLIFMNLLWEQKGSCFFSQTLTCCHPSRTPRSTGAIIMMGGLEFFRQGDLPEDSSGKVNKTCCHGSGEECGGLSRHPQGYDPMNSSMSVGVEWTSKTLGIRWFMKYLQECSAPDDVVIYQIFDIFGWFWVILNCKPQPSHCNKRYWETSPNNWSIGYLPLSNAGPWTRWQREGLTFIGGRSYTPNLKLCFPSCFPWTGTLDHLCGFLHSLQPHGYNTSGKCCACSQEETSESTPLHGWILSLHTEFGP